MMLRNDPLKINLLRTKVKPKKRNNNKIDEH